jgi:predicted dithiol-disulfide oxidoreductase (DUF899 family)
MSLPKVVSQEEWTAARRALLEKEKDFTRQRDRLTPSVVSYRWSR